MIELINHTLLEDFIKFADKFIS